MNGKYTYASPQLANLLGFQPEDVLGKTLMDLATPRTREAVITSYSIHYTKLYDRNSLLTPCSHVNRIVDATRDLIRHQFRITSYNVCYTKLLRLVHEYPDILSGRSSDSPRCSAVFPSITSDSDTLGE